MTAAKTVLHTTKLRRCVRIFLCGCRNEHCMVCHSDPHRDAGSVSARIRCTRKFIFKSTCLFQRFWWSILLYKHQRHARTAAGKMAMPRECESTCSWRHNTTARNKCVRCAVCAMSCRFNLCRLVSFKPSVVVEQRQQKQQQQPWQNVSLWIANYTLTHTHTWTEQSYFATIQSVWTIAGGFCVAAEAEVFRRRRRQRFHAVIAKEILTNPSSCWKSTLGRVNRYRD